MIKANRIKAGLFFGLDCCCWMPHNRGCHILKNDIYRLELQLISLQKEKDGLRDEIHGFPERGRNDFSALKRNLPLLRRSPEMNVSNLQKEVDRMRTDLPMENKNLQADLTIRLEALQSQLNRAQKEKETSRHEFTASRKRFRTIS